MKGEQSKGAGEVVEGYDDGEEEVSGVLFHPYLLPRPTSVVPSNNPHHIKQPPEKSPDVEGIPKRTAEIYRISNHNHRSKDKKGGDMILAVVVIGAGGGVYTYTYCVCLLRAGQPTIPGSLRCYISV